MTTILTDSAGYRKRADYTHVGDIAPPSSANKITYDAKVRGFGLRVTVGGNRSFVLNYRTRGGRERRYTIGDASDYSVEAARKEAQRLKALVGQGKDPMAEIHDERSAPTVTTLCDKYLDKHLPKKGAASGRNDRQMIDRFIKPRLGRLKVAAVEFGDIDGLHERLKPTPFQANRCLALLHKMFALASGPWKMRTGNPCAGIVRFPEAPRARYMKPPEMERLLTILAEWPDQTIANFVRLLLLTGCRTGELFQARWTEFDFDDGVWTKPSAHVKIRREHRLPLSAPALEILTAMRPDDSEDRSNSEWLFPGKDGKPMTTIKKSWGKIRKAADIADVRLHDLRHQHASILASANMSLETIGALLGHTQAQTTKRYAHLFDDPLRKAVERVGAVVQAAESGKSGEVVALKSK